MGVPRRSGSGPLCRERCDKRSLVFSRGNLRLNRIFVQCFCRLGLTAISEKIAGPLVLGVVWSGGGDVFSSGIFHGLMALEPRGTGVRRCRRLSPGASIPAVVRGKGLTDYAGSFQVYEEVQEEGQSTQNGGHKKSRHRETKFAAGRFAGYAFSRKQHSRAG